MSWTCPAGGRERYILHPAYPGSVYHATKCLDATLFQFYAKNDLLRLTDLHQGIVWGTNTDLTARDERQPTLPYPHGTRTLSPLPPRYTKPPSPTPTVPKSTHPHVPERTLYPHGTRTHLVGWSTGSTTTASTAPSSTAS